jgi:hypothetical protein
MSKARVSSALVLFLGLSALFVFGQLSHFGDNGPNASAGQGEMAVQTNVTKTFIPQMQITNNGTICVVLEIYNPTSTDAAVKLVAYEKGGTVIWTNPTRTAYKKSVTRMCTHILNPILEGWEDWQLINIGPNTRFAKITYPSTLRITGYIAWREGFQAAYDPALPGTRMPLVFF